MNKHESVQELFSRAAERFWNDTAIEGVGKRVTYGALEDKANNLANFLISSGAPRGSIVGIMAEDSVQVIAATIAVLKAGCVFVALDPALPEGRIQAMVSEVSPEWFVIESKFYARLNKMAVGCGLKSSVICVDDNDSINDPLGNLTHAKGYAGYLNTRKPPVESGPDDRCYIYFTSGSTGRPKGIVGRLKAIDHFIRWEIKTFGIEAGTRVSQLTSPSFDPFLRDVFAPLCAGGVVCLPNGRQTILDSRRLIDWIDIQQVNLIHCIPSLFRTILGEDLNPYYFSSLRYILLAGEPLLPSDVSKWMEVFGSRIQIANFYGPTETTMTKLFYFVKPSDVGRRSIPIGKPIDDTAVLLVDESGNLCPPGAVGEIYIQTPFLTLGYFNQPELTKEVFVENPFSEDPNDIVYKTGDFGQILEDGDIEFLGRKDQQVKIRGVRIELPEIESLLRHHEAVKDVVVVDREDPSGQKYLCAYVVPRESVESSSLRDHLSMCLPEYMVPSAFVVMKALPRTSNGKVDRKALPAPGEERSDMGRPHAAPRTPAEAELARIWRELLGVQRVGIHDNFFDLGGHSLSLTQLASRILEAFQVELPLESLFENLTVVDMTKAIAAAQAQQEDEADVVQLLTELKQLSPEEVKAMLDYEGST